MITYPIQSVFGAINKRTDCPLYSIRSRACKDGIYKICAPKRCNRIRGKEKAKSYGIKTHEVTEFANKTRKLSKSKKPYFQAFRKSLCKMWLG